MESPSIKGCTIDPPFQGYQATFWKVPYEKSSKLKWQRKLNKVHFFSEGYKTYGGKKVSITNISNPSFTYRGRNSLRHGQVYGLDITASNFTLVLDGFYYARVAGVHKVRFYADDAGSFQIGTPNGCHGSFDEMINDTLAFTQYSYSHRLPSFGVKLEASTWYPIRIKMINYFGHSQLDFRIKEPATSDKDYSPDDYPNFLGENPGMGKVSLGTDPSSSADIADVVHGESSSVNSISQSTAELSQSMTTAFSTSSSRYRVHWNSTSIRLSLNSKQVSVSSITLSQDGKGYEGSKALLPVTTSSEKGSFDASLSEPEETSSSKNSSEFDRSVPPNTTWYLWSRLLADAARPTSVESLSHVLSPSESISTSTLASSDDGSFKTLRKGGFFGGVASESSSDEIESLAEVTEIEDAFGDKAFPTSSEMSPVFTSSSEDLLVTSVMERLNVSSGSSSSLSEITADETLQGAAVCYPKKITRDIPPASLAPVSDPLTVTIDVIVTAVQPTQSSSMDEQATIAFGGYGGGFDYDGRYKYLWRGPKGKSPVTRKTCTRVVVTTSKVCQPITRKICPPKTDKICSPRTSTNRCTRSMVRMFQKNPHHAITEAQSASTTEAIVTPLSEWENAASRTKPRKSWALAKFALLVAQL